MFYANENYVLPLYGFKIAAAVVFFVALQWQWSPKKISFKSDKLFLKQQILILKWPVVQSYIFHFPHY